MKSTKDVKRNSLEEAVLDKGTAWSRWYELVAEYVEAEDLSRDQARELLNFVLFLSDYDSVLAAPDKFFELVGTNDAKMLAESFAHSIIVRKRDQTVSNVFDFTIWVLSKNQKNQGKGFLELTGETPLTRPQMSNRGHATHEDWIVYLLGDKWSSWQRAMNDYISPETDHYTKINKDKFCRALKIFLCEYLFPSFPEYSNIHVFMDNEKRINHTCGLELVFDARNAKDSMRRIYGDSLHDFFVYILQRTPAYADAGYLRLKEICPLPRSESPRFQYDDSYSWIDLLLGSSWVEWKKAAVAWSSQLTQGKQTARTAVNMFLVHYLYEEAPYASNVDLFFEGDPKTGHRCSSAGFMAKLDAKEIAKSRRWLPKVADFTLWILQEKYVGKGNRELRKLSPITRFEDKQVGRSAPNFDWIVRECGEEWQPWKEMSELWVSSLTKGLSPAREGVNCLIDFLYYNAPYAADPMKLFTGSGSHRISAEMYTAYLDSTELKQKSRIRKANKSKEFVDWVIDNYFSSEDEHGKRFPLPGVVNCIQYNGDRKTPGNSQTVRAALPYTYIKELREILCPVLDEGVTDDERDFRDWRWAYDEAFTEASWREVEEGQIDKDDRDCVWRYIEVLRNGRSVRICQMWSPVVAVLVYVKLHLPLRTFQVRFLDSGEADTWRYDSSCSDNWVENKMHNFMKGAVEQEFSRGVFRREFDSYTQSLGTSLFISTNKTLDQNKSEIDRGYTIPWQHEEILYWLEKLRNWQERYNPIDGPISAMDIPRAHFGGEKSIEQKKSLGSFCFLFRNAASDKIEGRVLPIGNSSIYPFWYQMMKKLEEQVYARGERDGAGNRIEFVEQRSSSENSSTTKKTKYPPHALRVSLLSAYMFDTDLPLAVISKLLAGHARLLMTIYYGRLGPIAMSEKFERAQEQLEESASKSLHVWLQEKSIEELKGLVAMNDADSVSNVIASDTNPLGWQERAVCICLMGGNNVPITDASTGLGGCFNGGAIVTSGGVKSYGPVPGGDFNCVRCRWAVAGITHLPALNAKWNADSYRVHELSKDALKIESEIDDLKAARREAAKQDQPWFGSQDLRILEARLERKSAQQDIYVQNLMATFNLIVRILRVEGIDGDTGSSDKRVAVGDAKSLEDNILFFAADSGIEAELMQLSLVCEDAEIYPEIGDDVSESGMVDRRSQILDGLLSGLTEAPAFWKMSKQEQLLVGNRLVRNLSKRFETPDLDGKHNIEGLNGMARFLASKSFLANPDSVYSALKQSSEEPIKKIGGLDAVEFDGALS